MLLDFVAPLVMLIDSFAILLLAAKNTKIKHDFAVEEITIIRLPKSRRQKPHRINKRKDREG